MATINATKEQLNPDSVRLTWANVGPGDTCAAYSDFSEYDDRTLQLSGTLDSATCDLQGSVDGTTFGTVNDQFGVALSAVGNSKPRAVSEYVYSLKPVFSGGGASQSATVMILAKRKRKST